MKHLLLPLFIFYSLIFITEKSFAQVELQINTTSAQLIIDGIIDPLFNE